MREEREPDTAFRASVTPFTLQNVSAFADGTKYVLPEHDAPQILPNLRFRRYLIEVVHASHDSEAVPTRSYYPPTYY